MDEIVTNKVSLREVSLVILFPFNVNKVKERFYGHTGFENQIMELGKYFKAITLYVPINRNKDSSGVLIQDPRIHIKTYCQRDETLMDFVKHLKNYHNIAKSIITNEAADSVFLTYIPGSLMGILFARHLRESNRQYFLRTVSDLGAEYQRRNHSLFRKTTGVVFKPLIDSYVRTSIGDVLNFHSGSVIYPSLKNQRCIISSSLTKPILRKTVKRFEEPYRILYVGRLEGEKGIKYLIRAVGLIDGHRVKVTIVGTGPHKNKLQKFVRALDLKDRVNFVGFVPFGPKLFDYYRKADIFVMPSLQEIQGKTHLEAMAFGTPVIVSDIAGIRSTVKNRNNGLLVDPANPGEISRAIIELIENPGLRKRLIKNGYDTAKKNNVKYQTKIMIKYIKRYFQYD